MALKWLPHYTDWDKSLAANKLQKDNGIRKALEDFWKLDNDQPDKRLAQLPKLLKLASDFKKSKEVVAAGPNAVKMVGELMDVIPKVRKEIEGQKKDFQSNGACSVDVQFLIGDWEGNDFSASDAYATFQSPGMPKVTKVGKVDSNGFGIDNVVLRPSGTVNLMVVRGSGTRVEGTTTYEFKPKPGVIMKFEATQHFKTHKTSARSALEVTKKFGLKGSAGIEWKIVKVDGEMARDSEYKNTYEDAVEWVIEEGLPAFKPFKQL